MFRSIRLAAFGPLLCWLVVLPLAAVGQPHRLLPAGDWTYDVIARLQRRGHLLALHPTALPYTEAEVAAALDEVDEPVLPPLEARWVRLLRRALTAAPPDSLVLVATFEAGGAALNTDRRDVLRPTDAGAPTLQVGAVRLFPEAGASALLAHNRLVADLSLHFDTYYRDDPDALDAAKRLIVRNASYVGYDGRFASAYLGRFDTHWAPPGEPALLVGANPAPYDRLMLRLGSPHAALRSILGELDNITADGRFTGYAGADSVRGSERRLLAAHRFDWRPSRRFALTFLEANLYSGPNTGVTLEALNPLPLHLFGIDEPPKNEENNGLLAGLLWLYLRPVTVQGQLLLDDVDILSETGEPPSIALAGSLHAGGLAPSVDVGARVAVVSSRVYNTHQAEGRYVYLLRGLGTQFNDYVEAAVFGDVYADRLVPGLVVSPQVMFLAQGEGDLRDAFPSVDVPFVLSGTVERTARVGAALTFQQDPRFWVRLDVGVNVVDNVRHVEGARETKVVGLLAFGLRLRTAGVLPAALR